MVALKILTILGLFYFVFTLVMWIAHISMVITESDEYGWGHFFSFKKEFLKYTWETDFRYPSLFAETTTFEKKNRNPRRNHSI
jgi:hypothetical protein